MHALLLLPTHAPPGLPLLLQDPNFDLLLGAMFGDIQDFEQRMLDPSVEVLERAMAVGHQIALVGAALLQCRLAAGCCKAPIPELVEDVGIRTMLTHSLRWGCPASMHTTARAY